MTTTYAVPNGTEIRVVGGAGDCAWSARLKITAGALGIVDVYDATGRWRRRLHWTPFSGLAADPDWSPVGYALAVAFHHYVNNRPRRQERRAAA